MYRTEETQTRKMGSLILGLHSNGQWPYKFVIPLRDTLEYLDHNTDLELHKYIERLQGMCEDREEGNIDTNNGLDKVSMNRVPTARRHFDKSKR